MKQNALHWVRVVHQMAFLACHFHAEIILPLFATLLRYRATPGTPTPGSRYIANERRPDAGLALRCARDAASPDRGIHAEQYAPPFAPIEAVPTNSRDNPRSDGEDKATGNDLVSPKKSGMQQAMATRPALNTLHTRRNGYLTADDVKGNKWLSKNFAKCDTNHDGQLSREEFANCHQ
jgi:hypothetical protein